MAGRCAAAALAIGGLLLTAGCSSSSPTPQPSPLPSTPKPSPDAPSLGTIDGRADPCGIGATRRDVITVHVQDLSGREVAQRSVRKPWTFTFIVRPGDYTVTAPAEADHPVRVRVSAGASAHVMLFSVCK
jgi:hypothetical protein